MAQHRDWQPAELRDRAVRRSIVDDHDMDTERQDALDHLADRFFPRRPAGT